MIQMSTNLDVVGDIVGTIEGMTAVSNDPQYIDALIKCAHRDASKAFDEVAVSAGMAGLIPHMFEFGTAGITRGSPVFSPQQPESHLWQHEIQGFGGSQRLTFAFKPAVMRNPQPTTASTGVPSKFLKKLSRRKYVFWNKAFVMETGMEVNIKGRNGNFVFVPFNGEASTGKYQNSKGYMMWDTSKHGPVKSVPGAMVQGRFTALWQGFWNGEGRKFFEAEVVKDYSADFEVALALAEVRSRANKPTPVKTNTIESNNRKAKSATKAAVKKRALARKNSKGTT